jgi:hypothetical protein
VELVRVHEQPFITTSQPAPPAKNTANSHVEWSGGSGGRERKECGGGGGEESEAHCGWLGGVREVTVGCVGWLVRWAWMHEVQLGFIALGESQQCLACATKVTPAWPKHAGFGHTVATTAGPA